MEVLEHLYTHLDSPDDFFVAWLANNRSQKRGVELALLSKKGIEFYPMQVKILTILVSSQSTLLGDDPEHLAYLGRKLSSQLKNPQLSTEQLMQGVKLIAALNNVALPLSRFASIDALPRFQDLSHLENSVVEAVGEGGWDSIIEMVQKKFDPRNMIERIVALDLLTALIPKADAKRLEQIVTIVKHKLAEKDGLINSQLAPFLSTLMSKADNKTLASLVDFLIVQLNDLNSETYLSSLENLAKLAPKIEKEKVVLVVDSVSSLLRTHYNWQVVIDKPSDIDGAALKCLTVLAPIMGTEEIEPLIEILENKLDNTAPIVHTAAAKCLVAFAPKMDKERIISIVESITNKLDDPNPLVQRAALNCLAELASIVEKEKRVLLIKSVTNRLDSKELDVRGAALSCLKELLLGIENESLSFPIDSVKSVKNMLDDDNENVRKNTIYFLTTLVKIEKESRASLIELVQDKLEDESDVVCCAALHCLTTLAAGVDKETLSSLIELVQDKLEDESGEVCCAALRCLTTLAAGVDKEILSSLIELVQDKLEDESDTVCCVALRCLTTLAAGVDKETLSSLIESIQNRLDDDDDVVRLEAFNSLAKLASRMENDTLKSLIQLVIGQLDEKKGSELAAALKFLTMVVVEMDEKTLKDIYHSVKNKLDHNSLEIRHAACHLMCYLLINTDENVTLDSSLLTRPEGLLVQTVSDWMESIRSSLNQKKLVEDNTDSDIQARPL